MGRPALRRRLTRTRPSGRGGWAASAARAALALPDLDRRGVSSVFLAQRREFTRNVIAAFEVLDGESDTTLRLALSARAVLGAHDAGDPQAAFDTLSALAAQFGEFVARDPRLDHVVQDLRSCLDSMRGWLAIDDGAQYAALTSLDVMAKPLVAGLAAPNSAPTQLIDKSESTRRRHLSSTARLLALVSRLLPAEERQSFVAEQLGSLAEGDRLEWTAHLLDLIVTMPSTAWVFRVERRGEVVR